MARSGLSINLGQGGLGQAALNTDSYSGMQFYGTAPGSFATTACQPVYSLADAASKGISNDYSDETAARAIYTVSGTVTVGDTFLVKVTEPNPNSTSTVVTLGTVTVATAATATGAATDIAAMVNAGTYVHGYTATSALGVVTLIAKTGLGVALNSGTPLAVTVTGTSTGVITQQFGTGSGGATAGVYSKKAIWYYTISEHFRQNPNTKLWVQFTATVGAAYAELLTLQSVANGECKRVGILNLTARSAAQVTADGTLIQTVADTLSGLFTPCVFVYAPNIKAVATASSLQNQQNQTNKSVTHCILQDGNAAGAQLYVNSGVSIPALGCVLGCSSRAAVSQDIGEIGAFNITNGTELAVPALTTGELISSLDSSVLDQLDAYRYLFATTLSNYTGTYINNDWTSIAQSSDYNRLSRNLVINKVSVGLYIGALPLLKSRLLLNYDGTLRQDTIEQFLSACDPAVSQMEKDGDISAYAITIDPAQDVLSTNKIIIAVKIVPVGIADFIQINLAYAVKI